MFSFVASVMRKLSLFLIISTLEHVAITFMGWIPLRKSFVLDNFGPRYLNIV
jgi:hypothetical protein